MTRAQDEEARDQRRGKQSVKRQGNTKA